MQSRSDSEYISVVRKQTSRRKKARGTAGAKMQTVAAGREGSPRSKDQQQRPAELQPLGEEHEDREVEAANGQGLSLALEDRELWTRFQCITNEMIVTKNGRWWKWRDLPLNGTRNRTIDVDMWIVFNIVINRSIAECLCVSVSPERMVCSWQKIFVGINKLTPS